MKNAADWVKILYTYGPFAILVLFVFVTEKKSRTALREETADRRFMLAIYVLNWVVIFGLVIFSVIAWKQINLDRTPQIRGRIENISNSELLSSNFADLYLHRMRQDNDRYSNYEWLLICRDRQLNDGETIVFTIDASKPESENILDFELPVSSDFYSRTIRLWRDKDDLYLEGQPKPLSKRRKTIGAPASTLTQLKSLIELINPTVHAQYQQGPSSVSDLTIGLESPDAIVRRKSRSDLANFDQSAALPWIDNVLQDPNTSYRLKLGVIVSLNNMPNLRKDSLRPSTITAIQDAVSDSDATLRYEAISLARKLDIVPVVVWEHAEFAGKSQSFGMGKYRADKGQLGTLPNDAASSLHVTDGFRARLCESEGVGGGDGKCQTFPAGWYSLKLPPAGVADTVSYIEVSREVANVLTNRKAK